MFLLAYLIISYEILANAVLNIFKGEIFDENFLMSVATIGALCLKDYPEAIMVMLLYSIGEFLQDKAVENSKKSITEIIDLRPDTANVLKNDKIINTPPCIVCSGVEHIRPPSVHGTFVRIQISKCVSKS